MLYYIRLVTGEELLSECDLFPRNIRATQPLAITRTFGTNGPHIVLVPWVTIVELNSLVFDIEKEQIVTMVCIDEKQSISSQYYEAVKKIETYINVSKEQEELEASEEEQIDNANTDLLLMPMKKGSVIN